MGIAIAQTLLFVFTAPLLSGFLQAIKCLLQNRQPPAIWQPYRNLNKLFKKEVIVPSTSSIIFRFVPYLVFSITVCICFFVPLFIVTEPTKTIADIITIIGLFSLSRFFIALAGMDSGTAFGGFGSSREMLIAAIAEPALLIVLFSIAVVIKTTNLSVIIIKLSQHNLWLQPSIIFAAIGFILVALSETGRVPVDNPATHLELTMIHEAMVLEYSGRYLALIEWASQIKFMLYVVLFVDLFFPLGIAHIVSVSAIGFSIASLFFKMIVLIAILSITEVNLAKLRLFRTPYILNLAFIFGLLAILIHLMIEVK